MIIGFFDKKKNITGKYTQIWGKWVCLSAGIKIDLEGIENLSKQKQYIFVSNHESMLDIPVALSQIPFNIIFLTKKELFNIPLFGWAMHAVGMIKVDRENRVKAKKSVESALKSLKEKNINVLIYPEGTRSKPNELLPFKKGSFILAIQSGLPIVPISIIYSGTNLPKKSLLLKNNKKIRLIIHEPINTSHLNIEKDKNILCQLAYDQISKELKKVV